jgi:hypothetical protein
MKTFMFIEQGFDRPTGKAVATYLQGRLARLAEIATTLYGAGWTVQLTDAGLSFEPPDHEEDHKTVSKKLAELGVKEEFTCFILRDLGEVLDANVEVMDRANYDNADQTLRHAEDPRCILCEKELEEEMAELEETYGRANLLIADDYQRGMLRGKLETLQWVLGADRDDEQCSDFDECDGDSHSEGKEENTSMTKMPGYCTLCRAKEIELFGTVLNSSGSDHLRACKEAGCVHPPYYVIN